MKTLTIKDLARTEELDSRSMAAVRGGWTMYSPSTKFGDVSYTPSYDSSITATQSLFQKQSVLTATANDAAFVHGVDVHSDVHQDGNNKIIG
jgi:hypothetical protein